MTTLLKVENLKVRIGTTTIVNDVSFGIEPNQCVGVVGESGSGKSTLALSLLGMVGDGRSGHIEGVIDFDGKRLDQMDSRQLRDIRGQEIAVVLQDPMSSLNPVFTVGNQLEEVLTCHQQGPTLSRAELRQRMVDALESVHIPAPEQRLKDYPHQLSGGMRQRIVGAMGIAASPRLLIADEPTTSLDATMQVQYLELLKALQRRAEGTERPLSILLITHDFGAVAKCCDRVCVMYAGKLVESGDVRRIFEAPAHPYTAALLASRPRLDTRPDRLPSIAGNPPRAGEAVTGCAFAPRCSKAQDRCFRDRPVLEATEDHHQVACWYPIQG